MRRRFIQIGVLEERDPRAVEVGFMKTDRLLNGELNRDELLRHYGFNGTRPVLLYAPTGAKHNSLETMGEEVLRQLATSDEHDILIKLHDHPKNKSIDWNARLAPFENEHFHIVREFDVIPSLFLADLLITDASSVANEYSLLDRPMVFLDVPELIKHSLKMPGAAVDLNTWGRRGGLLVTQPEEILNTVNQSLGMLNTYT